ncbi:MAG: sigma-54-dependent Fis family transcriptional regulator [Planctomycetota bacterium]|nr:MAG: sigma-54-dependent Fis family transcriptional regulator [Planctomycetota bacterium]
MESTAISVAQQILESIAAARSADGFRRAALGALQAALEVDDLFWVHQSEGGWSIVGSEAGLLPLPHDLIATAADQMEVLRGDGWLAVPIAGHTMPAELLLVRPPSALTMEEAQSIAALLHSGLLIADQQARAFGQVRQLQTLLDLANRWQGEHDPGQLLQSIAEAAAQALNGDRASIFLWDKANHELVGHPALGVPGGPLRIRDDQGIAGKVLKTGQPYRWDASQSDKDLNREVGRKLGYTTTSLVAVPLLDRKHRTIGVFEVLNHSQGRFSEEDQRFLIELARHAAAAVENTQHIAALVAVRDRLVQSASDSLQLVGQCPQIVTLRDTIGRVAPTELAVLILGENGTGKEVVARSLHLQSDRRDQPFIAVNCAAIAETLLESELFGHEKGAFTDAVAERAGKFELASGGTLLLDEIGEMSLGGQAKLLRVLEDKTVVRVGGSKPIHTDVRVIAATNQDLIKLVRAKKFREDLYFRLNVVTLQLPPLRERGDDVVLLAQHFLEQFAHQIGRRPPRLSEKAKRRLLAHSWPGNVRELRNLMERISYLTRGEVVEETDLQFVLSPASSADTEGIPSHLSLSDATALFQRQYIQRHIDAAGGNLARAAKAMGMHRSNLYRKMNQLGMSDPASYL